ncbi:hypothetical protein SAMD00023353_3400650 [Rosellinia necatrix]|uniref:Uncharacterized protein n=1 Tax=Rosellinia necatrix TaxID=77044 RepID=A0A1W2TL25_ROSNE|nr:hypothetical protein SAMD00023353_3400650 [Rosellinia necatrix]
MVQTSGGLGLRIGHRRISLLFIGLSVFVLFTLFFALPSAIPTGPSLSQSLADHKFSLPKYSELSLPKYTDKLNLFGPASHRPPEQKNSKYGGSSWYSNWNWRSPFSSSTTMDESRSLLPPLQDRTPIYCYYDSKVERDAATTEAESALLLTWRRAWWAQGLKPIILSAAEAMNNPLYREIQGAEMDPVLKKDIMRWLAWDNMGGGLLADYRLFPMGTRQEHLLSFLRRGEFPELTRWEDLGGALFAGPQSKIAEVMAEALQNRQQKSAKDLISAVSSDSFRVDSSHEALAYYGRKTIEKLYPKIAEGAAANRVQSLQSLNILINYHLHNTWQDLFSQGIAVLKPLPTHTTTLIEPAVELAKRLATCPDSPIPESCPPNLPKCTPCVSSRPMKISTPARYRNKTELYTIGMVPHPYTLRVVDALRSDIDVAYFRRETERDQWLHRVFQEHLGTGISASARVVTFKDTVAAEYAASRSLWLTDEEDAPLQDLDWWFGFAVPKGASDETKTESPAPDSQSRPKPIHDAADGPIPKDDELALEPELLVKAGDIRKSKLESDVRLRKVAEAWNMADTEAWRFARAFLARSRGERHQWEKEESKYAGGAGRDTSTRWKDDEKSDEK